MKTPQWFEQWRQNEFFHLLVSMRVLKWEVGILAAIILGVLIKVMLG